MGYRVNRWIKYNGNEISNGNKIVVERQIMKICEDYIISLLRLGADKSLARLTCTSRYRRMESVL